MSPFHRTPWVSVSFSAVLFTLFAAPAAFAKPTTLSIGPDLWSWDGDVRSMQSFERPASESAASSPAPRMKAASSLLPNGSFDGSSQGWGILTDSTNGTLRCEFSEKNSDAPATPSSSPAAVSGSGYCQFQSGTGVLASNTCVKLDPNATYVLTTDALASGHPSLNSNFGLEVFENDNCTGFSSVYANTVGQANGGQWDQFRFVFKNVKLFHLQQPWKSARAKFQFGANFAGSDQILSKVWLDNYHLVKAGYNLYDDFAGCQMDQSKETLCLAGHRFKVTVDWRTSPTAVGKGKIRPLTDDSGTFWFFGPENIELNIKVLNACSLNNHFWIFSSASTDVAVKLTVTDLATGSQKIYQNPAGQTYKTITDVKAFPCP